MRTLCIFYICKFQISDLFQQSNTCNLYENVRIVSEAKNIISSAMFEVGNMIKTSAKNSSYIRTCTISHNFDSQRLLSLFQYFGCEWLIFNSAFGNIVNC